MQRFANTRPTPGNRNAAALLLGGAFFFFINACHSPAAHTAAGESRAEQASAMQTNAGENEIRPPSEEIRYNGHETPKIVKGANLAADLLSTAAYQKALSGGAYGEMAYLFLEHYKKWFQLEAPRRELRLDKVWSDALDTTHVQLQQVVKDVPVWGKTIGLHFKPEGCIYLFQGDYAPGLTHMNTRPGISAGQAVEAALSAAADSGDWTVAENTLYVFAPSPEKAHLVYGVTLRRGIMERRLWMVDAVEGWIVHTIRLNPS